MKINDPRTLNRRELTGCFLTFGLAMATIITMPPRDQRGRLLPTTLLQT